MRRLRLIADDLTGALDAAAQFTGGGREIAVFIGRIPAGLPEAFAVDIACREEPAPSAAALAVRFAPLAPPDSEGIAFWKVDSLLRGNTAVGVAAAARSAAGSRVVIAPAFPHHGRVVRRGRLHLREGAGWRMAGPDLAGELRSLGLPVEFARPGDPIPEGASLWDAETDGDLRRIAAAGRGLRVLWCGSGGLAAALAPSEPAAVAPASLRRPVLGIFGSDHPATRSQLDCCAGDVLTLPADSAAVAGRLSSRGICFLRFGVPAGARRDEARAFIESQVAGLCAALAEPATVVVSGGETLRSLCGCLGAGHLRVSGQVAPGVPVSRAAGGRWERAVFVSKSGAFGEEGFLSTLTGSCAEK
jgi:uncharacterized protein YgbK (DUF1537 family)